MNAKPFLDTNILIYAFASGEPRAARAEELLAAGGIVSVQVLNEFVNVSRKKLGRSWAEIEEMLAALDVLLAPPLPVTHELHRAALGIARDHMLGFYDALIAAAANTAKCETLYSEDMQDGLKVGETRIRNPFV